MNAYYYLNIGDRGNRPPDLSLKRIRVETLEDVKAVESLPGFYDWGYTSKDQIRGIKEKAGVADGA